MRTKLVAMLFYGALLVAAGIAAWFVAPWLLSLVTVGPLGAGLTAVFAALYIGELKQESIGQLYQALASANLKSAEIAAFSECALERIRSIRRLFLFSNIIKLLGTLGGLYLLNEKTVPIPGETGVLRFALGMLFFSTILFARLWAEVSSTESLLIAIKQEAALKAKRDAFLASGRSAQAYDFGSDPVAQSFDAPPAEPLLMPAGH